MNKMMLGLVLLLLSLGEAFANESDQFEALNQKGASIAKTYQNEVESLSRAAINQSSQFQQQVGEMVAQSKQLPPKPQAQGVIVFVSLGMPTLILRQILLEANAMDIPVVVRGVLNNDFKQSAKALYAVLHPQNQPEIKAGVSIDPIWFKEFDITVVPAVVAIGNAKPCYESHCPTPPYDVLYGNIPIAKALKLISDRGEAAQGIAKTYLQKLGDNNAY